MTDLNTTTGGSDSLNKQRLFDPGRRTTKDTEMLVIEARMADRGESIPNPAFPFDDETREEVMPILESKGYEPAWVAEAPAQTEYEPCR